MGNVTETNTLALLQAALILVAATVPSGTVVESRPATPFDSIVLRDIGDPALEQGPQESVTVIAEARFMPQILTTVRNGTLYPELTGNVSTQLPLRDEVSARKVKSIRSEGSGSVELRARERLGASIAGSGAVR